MLQAPTALLGLTNRHKQKALLFQVFIFTQFLFLLITKRKEVVNIFSLYFYPVTVSIFAKIKV